MSARSWIPLLLIGLAALPATGSANGPRALFDNTHAQTAANADWVIDTDQPLPVPDQSTVTAATPRDYWLGANSSWGIDLVKRGYFVATLTPAFGITYGNAGNPYDLSNFDVFIVNEPNTRFTAPESTAIFNFVRDGGGLIAVSDHNISDRNNDDFDSPRIWDRFDAQHFLGAHFDTTGETNNNITQDSDNAETSLADSIIHGPNGVADGVSFHNGTTMVLYPGVNPTVTGDIWMNGQVHGTSNVMAAHAVYGNGRVFWVGDSSPADDGSASPNNTVFDGWSEASGRDSLLFLNATMWVTRRCTGMTGFSPVYGDHGSTVTITGTHLELATEVRFDGVLASFTIQSPTSLAATVPAGATAGPLVIVGACGSVTSDAFFYPPAWPTCGVAVQHGTGNQQSPATLPDGAGGAFVVWQDDRGASVDLYAQRMNGNGQPLWPEAGVAVCTAGGAQTNPVLISDGAGGMIVAWQDSRAGNFDAYAARVNGGGTVLWTALACYSSGDEMMPSMASDGAGGEIIAWQDHRPGGGGSSDIYVNRLDLNGNLFWSTGGLTIGNTVSNQYRPVVMADGSSGAFIAWADDGSQRALVQHIQSNGSTLWQAQGIAAGNLTAAGSASQVELAPDGSGGVIVITGGGDIVAQRLNANGQAQWTSPDVVLCAAAGAQNAPAVTADGAGGAVVAWVDARVSSGDIYSQRVNASGTPQWTSQGVLVCDAAGQQLGPRIVGHGGGEATVAWQDPRAGSNDVYAQRLSAGGVPEWAANGIVVCSGSLDQSSPTMVPDASGGVLVGWQDNQTGSSYDVRMMRVRSDGSATAVPWGTDAGERRLLASPDPFRDAVRLSFTLPSEQWIRMEVLDVTGRRVRIAPSARFSAGPHVIEWDGRADGGTRLGGGIFFVRLHGPGFDRVQPVVHLE